MVEDPKAPHFALMTYPGAGVRVYTSRKPRWEVIENVVPQLQHIVLLHAQEGFALQSRPLLSCEADVIPRPSLESPAPGSSGPMGGQMTGEL